MHPFFINAGGITTKKNATDNDEAIRYPEDDALYNCIDVMTAALDECYDGPLEAATASALDIAVSAIKLSAGIDTPREIVSECFTGLNARMLQTRYAREGLISSIIEAIKKFFSKIAEFFGSKSSDKSADKKIDHGVEVLKNHYEGIDFNKSLPDGKNASPESIAEAKAFIDLVKNTPLHEMHSALEKLGTDSGNPEKYKHVPSLYKRVKDSLYRYVGSVSVDTGKSLASDGQKLAFGFAIHNASVLLHIHDYAKKMDELGHLVDDILKLLRSNGFNSNGDYRNPQNYSEMMHGAEKVSNALFKDVFPIFLKGIFKDVKINFENGNFENFKADFSYELLELGFLAEFTLFGEKSGYGLKGPVVGNFFDPKDLNIVFPIKLNFNERAPGLIDFDELTAAISDGKAQYEKMEDSHYGFNEKSREAFSTMMKLAEGFVKSAENAPIDNHEAVDALKARNDMMRHIAIFMRNMILITDKVKHLMGETFLASSELTVARDKLFEGIVEAIGHIISSHPTNANNKNG